jgi:hypothetical protein
MRGADWCVFSRPRLKRVAEWPAESERDFSTSLEMTEVFAAANLNAHG